MFAITDVQATVAAPADADVLPTDVDPPTDADPPPPTDVDLLTEGGLLVAAENLTGASSTATRNQPRMPGVESTVAQPLVVETPTVTGLPADV